MPTSALAATVTAAALALSTALTPAANPADNASCNFRIAVVHALAEMSGDTSPRAQKLRTMLIDSGANEPDFLPKRCINGGGSQGGGQGGNNTGGGTGNNTGGGAAGKNGHCKQTAAQKLGWGTPNRSDDFNGSKLSDGWSAYDGPGHAGNGRRTPDAAKVSNGQLTLTGSPNGDSAGLAWNPGQKYGRWEGCVQSPTPASDSMHSLLLLWPDAENFPEGGEVDFMEISDATRKTTETFLHFGADNSQETGKVDIDATQWHAFAVEWTPDGITNYVDGKKWWSDTEKSHLPPDKMHLCIQLDYFGGKVEEETLQHTDWVRQYSPAGGSSGGGDSSSSGADNNDDGDSGGSQ